MSSYGHLDFDYIANLLELPQATVARFFADDRLYKIVSNKYYRYWTATCSDKEGSLFVALSHQQDLYVNEFDSKGRHTSSQVSYVEKSIIPSDETSGLDDSQIVEYICSNYHCSISPIEIHSFYQRESGIGINAVPPHYEAFLQGKREEHELDPGEERFTIELIRGWIEDGNYELCWGNDYYMSAEGEVESS